jgi:hypothetical protein
MDPTHAPISAPTSTTHAINVAVMIIRCECVPSTVMFDCAPTVAHVTTEPLAQAAACFNYMLERDERGARPRPFPRVTAGARVAMSTHCTASARLFAEEEAFMSGFSHNFNSNCFYLPCHVDS